MVLNSSSSMKTYTRKFWLQFKESVWLETTLRDHLVQLSFCRWGCWGPTETRPQIPALCLVITQCVVSTSSQGVQQLTQTTRLCLSSLTGFRIKLASNLRSKAIWSISIYVLPHLECNQGKVSWEVALGPPPRTKQSDSGQISAVLWSCLRDLGDIRARSSLYFSQRVLARKICSGLGFGFLLFFWRWEMAEMRAERKWSVKGSMLLFSR